MKQFLEKRWWVGVAAIAAIMMLVFAFLQFVITEKPEDMLIPTQQRAFSPC